MSTAYIDDRPIQPNKQYLEQKQQQFKQKKQFHDYLKKHQPFEQVLPCFREKIAHINQKKAKAHKESSKTKAEIYEQIKRKNLQKFGEKKQKQYEVQEPETKKKKIDPSKMTIQYKPKNQVKIQTDEYRQTSQKKQRNLDQSQEQKRLNYDQSHIVKSQRQKYEKLLQLLQKQKQQLNQDKQSFEKQKDKLQFKKLVQKEENVPFLNEIKKQIQQKKRHQLSHRMECQTNKQQNQQSVQLKKISRNKLSKRENQKSKTNIEDISEIKSRILKLQQQKQQIQDQVYRNKRQVIDSQNNIASKRYPLYQCNQIPNFNVECFRDFIDIKTLYPKLNQFYKIALEVFQTGLNAKEAKIKLNIENLDFVKQNDKNDITSISYKRRFQGQVRITKYNNGWVEVWTPGVQRLMGNKQLGYKVVWLKNGDIKQQWKDPKLSSYYSKQREVVQLQLDKFQPIYFFLELKQLQQYQKAKKMKTVMFRDGRIEEVSLQTQNINGFSF